MSDRTYLDRTVLIVDDDENILDALQRLLRNEPYQIIAVSCGAEAIGILNTKQVDLIVCDYTMPGPAEEELFQLIRRRWPESVRVLITGHYDSDALVEAVRDGEAYRFVQKPWNDDELILTIRQSLEKVEMQNEIRRLADEAGRCRKKISESGEKTAESDSSSAQQNNIENQ